MKRVLSLLLAVCMVISMVPSVFAEEPAAEPEEEVVVVSEPEAAEEVTAEPEMAPAEEPTEAAEPEAAETEAAAEETEAAEEAAEETTEEVTEEVTEEAAEAAGEETEEAPAAKEEESVEQTVVWAMPEDAVIRQTANNKVTISWETCTDGDKPVSYVVAELVNDEPVKRGYTTGTSVTISSVAYGQHEYAIFPCTGKKGNIADCDLSVCVKQNITTVKQTWRSAPSVKVSQIDSKEMMAVIFVKPCDTALYYLFELTSPNGVINRIYDVTADHMLDPDDALYQKFVPAAAKADDALLFTCDISKSESAAYEQLAFGFRFGEDSMKYSCTVKTRVYAIGSVNDDGELAKGTSSAKKTITLKPQWSKAPQILAAAPSVRYDSESGERLGTAAHLEWRYYGVPTSFDVYEGKTLLGNIPVTEDVKNNQIGINIPLDTAGKHTFKIYPVYETSTDKTVGSPRKVTVNWLTAKPSLTLSQPAEDTVRMDWSYIDSAIGYYVYQVSKSGDEPVVDDESGETYLFTGTTADLTVPQTGSYSYKVVPVGQKWGEPGEENLLLGKVSAKKTIKVKELWKAAPKNVTVEVVDAENNTVRIRWDALGAPTQYVIKIKQGKKVHDQAVIPASADSARMLEYKLPGTGTYTISVCGLKDDVRGAWSAAKKFVYKGQSEPDRTYRALLIGNTYEKNKDVSSLPGCKNDVLAMESLLNTMNATPYSAIAKIDLGGQEILDAIAEAFQGATEDDVSLFYYSGHGYDQTGYLVGNDSVGVRFATLRRELDKIPGTKIVLLDSCFSGQSINKGDEATDAELAAYADAAMAAFYEPTPKSGELAARNYYVMTACRKDQTSAAVAINTNEGRFPFSIFTYAFGMAAGWNEIKNEKVQMNGDTNFDGLLTLAEAFIYTDHVVKENGYSQVTRVNPVNSPFVLFGRTIG